MSCPRSANTGGVASGAIWHTDYLARHYTVRNLTVAWCAPTVLPRAHILPFRICTQTDFGRSNDTYNCLETQIFLHILFPYFHTYPDLEITEIKFHIFPYFSRLHRNPAFACCHHTTSITYWKTPGSTSTCWTIKALETLGMRR